MKFRYRGITFALVAALGVTVTACDIGDGGAGSNPSRPASVGTSPDASSAPELSNPPAGQGEAVFEVEADSAEYWRMLTLDVFDGTTWTPSQPSDVNVGVRRGTPTLLPEPGHHIPPEATTLRQRFRILEGFDTPYTLPMAQTAVQISGAIGDIAWDPGRSQASAVDQLAAGTEYTVRSQIVVPTPKELDRVEYRSPRAYGQWTRLPAELDPRIEAMAERWTEGATSGYRKVLAIQQRFQNGQFVYSTDVEPPQDGNDLYRFLTQTKAGFCQHYSSAMAVMVRTLGLPARIGVGFRAGTKQEDGKFLVRTGDAHVWVEVLFPGYGWLQFEPEPGTTHPNALPGTYLQPVRG